MNIGFIGAGKVGCSLGKYFSENAGCTAGNFKVKGYFSLHGTSSQDAAKFTDSKAYDNTKDIIDECDIIFLTVPDGSIGSVWESISQYDLKGKLVCHCSGAMSSEDAFEGIEESGAFGYSVHPLFAVSDKYRTYRELAGVFFTLEGCRSNRKQTMSRDKLGNKTVAEDDAGLLFLRDFLESMGNPTGVILPDKKTKYHCGAAVASNLVCGLIDMSIEIFRECGFEEDAAVKALAPIIAGNALHIAEAGPAKSLTGPIERNDTGTVEKHIECLQDSEKESEKMEGKSEIYRLLSCRLVDIAERRHPERDYSKMLQILRKEERK